MKIERFSQRAEMTLEAFADRHDLTLRVCERIGTTPPYVAHFKGCAVKLEHLLSGRVGYGQSELEAIQDYCTEIAGQTLVIDAFGPNRREITVPAILI